METGRREQTEALIIAKTDDPIYTVHVLSHFHAARPCTIPRWNYILVVRSLNGFYLCEQAGFILGRFIRSEFSESESKNTVLKVLKLYRARFRFSSAHFLRENYRTIFCYIFD